MIARHSAVLLRFAELHGDNDGVGIARAPGRVNIIGEHTDYNEGYVLPMAISRDTVVAFRPNGNRRLNVHTMTETGEEADGAFSLDDADVPPRPRWMSYVAGVVRVLQNEGIALPGVDMVVHTTLPVGGGLSSSAALEVSTALALTSAAGVEVERKKLALLCQRAECDFAGMRCGVMDQYVSLFAEEGCAVLLDCRTLDHELVACPTDLAKFVVCDTEVRHELASSEYNKRRHECEQGSAEAERILKDRRVHSLRDLDVVDLSALEPELDPVVFRRVRHVVTENARVVEAARSMRQKNYIALGVLMDASHESLRDDYEVSCKELDILVEAAWSQTGVYGSRMTGGGFGGCTITLVDAARVDAFCKGVALAYESQTGMKPSIHICTPGGAAEVLRKARSV